MQNRQKYSIEMVFRVHDFLAAYPPPVTPGYTTQKTILDDIVAKLDDHSSDQVAGQRLSRAEVERRKALRRKLREEHIGPICQIARVSLADQPGIDQALRLPSDNLATLKLVAEANAIRKAAALYSQTFINSGRPEDFLAQLDAAIGAVEGSVLGRARNVGLHIGAKAGLKKEIRRARRAVEVMDTIVRAAFAGQSDVLAKWRAARRIQGVPADGAPSDEPGAPVTPGADVTPAASSASSTPALT